MSMNYKGKKPVVDCTGDKGFTVQADRDDADINKIIARFEKAGSMARLNTKEPFYGDVSHLHGLADSIMKVKQAEELFMAYPAELRERFDNDPADMIEFLEDPANLDEAIKLGLAVKRPDPIVPVPEPGTPPAPAA